MIKNADEPEERGLLRIRRQHLWPVKDGEMQRRAGNMKYGDVMNDKEKTTKNLIMFHKVYLFLLEGTRCHN